LGDPSIYNQTSQHPSENPAESPDQHTRQRNAFSPNFDVHETETAYVLEGELPGLSDKNAVNIEFTDHSTLLIRGRIERSYHSASPQSTESEQQQPTEKHTPPKPTVEEEEDEADKKAVAQTSQKKEVSKKQQGPQVRYWVTERSIGSFQRTFNFPGLVDQDAVTARLKDGILTVTVPKKQHTASRRIQIE